MPELGRLAPFLLLVSLLAAFALTGGFAWLEPGRVAQSYVELETRIEADRPLALALFVLGYALLVSTAMFPAAFLLTMLGGLFFGPWTGAAASVAGATAGGTVAFLAARRAFAALLARRLGRRGRRFALELQDSGTLYLLALRLTPLPFWMVTLAAALSGMAVRKFVGGTILGAFPISLIFARIGASAGESLRATGALDPAAFAQRPDVILPMSVLALLTLGAIWARTRMRRRSVRLILPAERR